MNIACERREENVQAAIRSSPASALVPGVCGFRAGLSTGKSQACPLFAHRPGGRESLHMQSLPEPAVTDAGESMAWQVHAECVPRAREVDFFPARGESVRDAKAVCAVCPVTSECLEFALRLNVAHGVWGGLSERERRNLRRDRRRSTT
jgi:WhiB family transcriptional regulator, redox-sensing transcriptional regulator